MRLIWNVKLYSIGSADKPYLVKIEGNPSLRGDVPWIFAVGKGQAPDGALSDAISTMSEANAQQFIRFMGASE